MPPVLTIIVPVFNDLTGLTTLWPKLTDEIKNLPGAVEILVIDDGSNPEIPESDIPGARLLRHRRNKGYGASIKTGIRKAQAPFVLLLDADGQHNPADIPRFFNAAQESDLVVGLRSNLTQGPLWRLPGKFVLALLFRIMTQVKTWDFNCGYRCLRTTAIRPLLHLCSNQFSFSMTSTMLMEANDADLSFIPIQAHPRIGASTIGVRTGFDTLLLFIRMLLLTHPLRVFLPLSVLLVTGGVLWGLPYALAHHGVSTGALFILITGFLTFLIGIGADIGSQLLRNLRTSD